jgi:plasmid replication initiation protein
MSTFSKPNILIESHCTFSIYGHRIVNNIISKYNNKDSDIKVFGIDFKDFIGKNASGSQYTIAKKVLTELKSQYYEYQKSHNNIIKIYPFESCNIVNGHPRIQITITSEFLEVLKTYNSSNYTILNYDNILNMTSTHSIRIYELLQQYYNTDNKYRILELKDLKYYLGITKEYCNYYDFKRVFIYKN